MQRNAGYDDNGYEVYEEDDECSIVPESTLLTLTISYDLPKAGVFILESLGPAGKEFIQQTLLGDLKRFRERLVRDLRDERMESFRKSQIGRNYGKNAELLQWLAVTSSSVLSIDHLDALLFSLLFGSCVQYN